MDEWKFVSRDICYIQTQYLGCKNRKESTDTKYAAH